MKYLKAALVTALFLMLFGCAATTTGTYELANAKTGVIVSDVESRIIRANCLVEKNKINLPIPPQLVSCKSEQRNALSSFMAGACGSSNLRQQEQYNAVLLKTINEREEVYSICLLKDGLSEIWVVSPQT